MTGIHVLSTGVSSSKSKEERFSVADTQQGSEGVVMDFAALLSGWAQQISGQGQNSGFQSNDPAGKEANSGQNAIVGMEAVQGLVGAIQGYSSPQQLMPATVPVQREQKTKDKDPLQNGLSQMRETLSRLDQANLLVQVEKMKYKLSHSYLDGNIGEGLRAGMKPEQPQGKRIPESELDQYKEVISHLLKEMSGEIKEGTQTKGDFLSSSMQWKSGLAMHRLNTGLVSISLDKQGSPQGSLVTEESLKPVQETSSSTFDKTFSGVPLESSVVRPLENPDEAQLFQGLVQADEPLAQEIGQTVISRSPLDSRGIQEERKERGQDSALIEEFFDALDGKEGSEPPQLEENDKNLNFYNGKDLEKPHLVKENFQLTDRVENKANLPVWVQVAREIHEKAFQARPQITDLDIHLHPAELGQIRIFLSWEEGQVHLRMTASEPATAQALQSTFTELRDTLSQMGVQCGMLEMGLGNQSKNSRQQGQEILQTSREKRDDYQGIQMLSNVESMSRVGSSTGLNDPTGDGSRINVTV